MGMSRSSTGALVVLLCLGALAGLTALPASQAQEPTGRSSQAVSEQDLRMFANAYVRVSDIYTTYERMINDAGDAERARSLQQEANRRMNRAVEDEGLSVPEYNAIFSLVEEDTSLQKRINRLLEEE